MKTAVIYARYSSDSQTEQSIEGQLRVCQQYAQSNDILILDKYIDRAMTGTNDARPDFQRMIKDSNKKQWDYVIVYKLDRFSRNKYENIIHKHTLSNNGVKVLSAMENIPDTPEGIILESLLEGMNQYYSAELSQKVRRGLTESYLKGNFTGGNQLYGYDVVNKKNVINPNESEIVKEIFDKYANGFTAVQIGKELKTRGIRTKDGKYVDSTRIYKMLFNTKYNGKVKHGDTVYTNIYPAIVDDITWQKVQDIHQSNKHAPGRKKDIFDFILSGKLVCKHCGTLLVGESGTGRHGEKHYYYNCLSRRRKKINCSFKAIKKQKLENKVFNLTWELFCNENYINLIANLVLKKHEQETKQNLIIKSLESKRTACLKATNNLISAIEEGIVTEQTKIRLKELEAQISQLDFDIEQERQRSYSFLTFEKITSYLKRVICGDIETVQTRQHITKTAIREIVLDNNNLFITYNFTDEVPPPKNHISDDIKEIEEQVANEPVIINNFGSYKLENIPPRASRLNFNSLDEIFLFSSVFSSSLCFNIVILSSSFQSSGLVGNLKLFSSSIPTL